MTKKPPKPTSSQEESLSKEEEYLAGWKRALADYDNLKRDLAKERDEGRRRLIEHVTDGFLKVLEHFDTSVKHQPDLSGCDEETRKQVGNWMMGVGYIRTAMVEELKGLGLEPIEPQVGDVFNAQTQASVKTTHQDGCEMDVIVEVVARGWRLGEKVIRPAQVIINQ